MKPKFDHIHYRASNFDQTRHFYVEIMEAEDLGPIYLNDKEHLHFQLGGVTLLFAQGDATSPDPGNSRLGAYHIALLVDDCAAAVAYYTERGATVATPPPPVKVVPPTPTPNYTVAFLQAPDGMQLELKQNVG